MKPNTILTIVCFAVLSAISGFHLREDPEFLSRLRTRLASLNKSVPEEKVYLQFDKPFYKPGEDIWFNAFILNGTTYKPTHTSDVLYADLIDPKGNIVHKLELLIREGTTNGDFRLDDTAPGGMYKVKAYTRWNQNAGEETFFTKEIQVQRVITPRLLFRFDFDREAYGQGDEVTGTLSVKNLKNEAAANAMVRALVDLHGKRLTEFSLSTDNTGKATVRFTLPESLSSADGLLQMIVTSAGVEESVSRSIPIVLNKISLQFFPEGGNRIDGIPSRVAFKALNEFGKGADVTGVILNERGETVSSFESFHMGMGAFDLGPESQKYFVRIESPAGNDKLIPLPEPVTAGMMLGLKEKTDKNTTWVVRSSRPGNAFFVAQSHGTIHHAEKIMLTKGENTLTVTTGDFPAGITMFTLFDETGKPQSERLVYLNKERVLRVEIRTDKDSYLPGEEVQMTIKTTDPDGRPLPAKLSIGVADDQLIAFADDKQDNLLSRMYLTSEVRGEIQKPSFYFDPEEPKADKALDYLLMTQGWRRFSWEDLRDDTPPLAWLPEKIKAVSGRVVSKNGEGRKAEVTLLELGNQKRISKIETTNDGLFVFRNVDPTVSILLLTGKENEIRLQKEKYVGQPSLSLERKVFGDEAILVAVEEEEAGPPQPLNVQAGEVGLDMNMDNDVAQLSEVVVTGYGAQTRQGLIGSVTVVYQRDLDNFFPSVESALQGKVSGIQIDQPNYGPSALTGIRIRGISSLGAGRGDPLFVIDGHQIGAPVNGNFSNGSFIDPEEIESIEVLKSSEATALFGSEGINGVVLITTKNGIGHGYFSPRNKPSRYASILITPRKFSAVREFYTSPPGKNDHKRNDFRTTVYWNPLVVTNEKGVAKVSFHNNDAVSAFRITAEGIGGSGFIGRTETVYNTLLPFSIDAKLPAYLGYEDILELPVRVANETKTTLNGTLSLDLPGGLSVKEPRETRISVGPGSSQTYYYTLTTTSVSGDYPLKIHVDAGGRKDEIARTITVKPVGFPMRVSFSGKSMERHVRFNIADAERGSLHASLTAYPDVLSDLMAGVEGIFREPYGCFEQTSSSTFPNILALQYIRNSGTARPDVERKAMEYIVSGYKRLISYEVKGGGFEWFGNPPAHEALTAYGLLEFLEMKKVYAGVDDKMIERTRDWLLSRRNGDGTFQLQSRGFDNFSRPSGNIANAYITYTLSETGTKDLDKEFAFNLGSAWTTKDTYQLALVANTAFNLGKSEEYQRLIHHYTKTIGGSSPDQMTASHSVVWSQGESLTTETTALWALALMKSGISKMDQVKPCIDYILSRRSFGRFGSTQATVLALKALVEYARLVRSASHGGDIRIMVNNHVFDSASYDKDTRNPIELKHFERALTYDGEQRMGITFANTPEPLPYSLNIEWHTKRPQSSKECKVAVRAQLSRQRVKLNETVRFTVQVENVSSGGIPMTMAIVGIPAGLSVQPWQLKELQEKNIFDFYEITDGKLVLYYRQMQPKELRDISLDLKAELKGTFTAPASCAYLYYTDEFKHWVKGSTIMID